MKDQIQIIQREIKVAQQITEQMMTETDDASPFQTRRMHSLQTILQRATCRARDLNGTYDGHKVPKP